MSFVNQNDFQSIEIVLTTIIFQIWFDIFGNQISNLIRGIPKEIQKDDLIFSLSSFENYFTKEIYFSKY